MRGEVSEKVKLLRAQQEQRQKLARLRRDTLRKSAYLQKKPSLGIHDVYRLTKEFFQSFLEKPYEFTIAELQKELKSVYISRQDRDKIGILLGSLGAIEYRDVNFKREQLLEMLSLLESIVQALVRIQAGKQGFWERLKDFFVKEDAPEALLTELPAIEEDDAMNVRMRTLVERCYVFLDKKQLKRAKASYSDLLNAYADLPRNEKERLYPLIEQTYQDLMNRHR